MLLGRSVPEVGCQEKAIELTDRFPEVKGQRREDLCAAFSEAIEWGRLDERDINKEA